MTPQPCPNLQHGVDLPLRNHRHEAFAQRVVTGESLSQAYRQVYGTDAKAAGANGARLMKNDSVRRRVAQLQRRSADGAVMALTTKREYLYRVVMTAIAEVDEQSDLCAKFERTAHCYRKAMPDKIRAIELDSKLAGHFPTSWNQRRNNKP